MPINVSFAAFVRCNLQLDLADLPIIAALAPDGPVEVRQKHRFSFARCFLGCLLLWHRWWIYHGAIACVFGHAVINLFDARF